MHPFRHPDLHVAFHATASIPGFIPARAGNTPSQPPSGGMGCPVGFDYAGCRAALAGSGIRWRDVREGVQVMEAEVLAWLRALRAQPPRS